MVASTESKGTCSLIERMGNMESVADSRYYVRWRGNISGPFGGFEILHGLQSGKFSKLHQVSGDRTEWVAILEHDDFAAACGQRPAPQSRVQIESVPAEVADRPRLQLKNKVELAADSPGDRWFYAEDEVVGGPVGLHEIQELIDTNQLPPNLMVCREDEEIWQTASEALAELEGRNAAADNIASEHSPMSEPAYDVSRGEEKVCLTCGRIHRGRGSFCQNCGKPLDLHAKEYGGIGRLGYVLFAIILGVVQVMLTSLVGTLEGEGVLIFLFSVLHFVPVCLRLQNLGMSGWWSLLLLVPIGNVAVTFYCLVFPKGYNDTKELDAAGRIMIGVVVCFFLICLAAGVWWAAQVG